MSFVSDSTELDVGVRDATLPPNRHVSPAVLSVLIHCHALVEPLPESAVHGGTVKWFLEEGIIEPCPRDRSCGYTTTERGRKWLDMILATPMPVSRWIDPREEKAEE